MDSSHSGSTMKDQNSYWTPSDAYDSSETSSSTSNYDGSHIHDYVKTLPKYFFRPKNVCLQQICHCQVRHSWEIPTIYCCFNVTTRIMNIVDFTLNLPRKQDILHFSSHYFER